MNGSGLLVRMWCQTPPYQQGSNKALPQEGKRSKEKGCMYLVHNQLQREGPSTAWVFRAHAILARLREMCEDRRGQPKHCFGKVQISFIWVLLLSVCLKCREKLSLMNLSSFLAIWRALQADSIVLICQSDWIFLGVWQTSPDLKLLFWGPEDQDKQIPAMTQQQKDKSKYPLWIPLPKWKYGFFQY